jgi:hypothetical protein
MGTPVTISTFSRLNVEIWAEKSSGEIRVAAGIHDLVAGLPERAWEALLLVAPGIAVAIVRPEGADYLGGLDRVPHVDEDPDDVLQPPEEVIRRLEPGVRLAAAGEEPRLPRAHRGDARRAVHLALIGDGIGGLRRARHQHEIDLVGEDEARGHLGGAVRIGLAVAHEHLDGMQAPADPEPLAEGLADPAHHEAVGLAEAGQRAGLGAHVADLDGAPGALGPRRPGTQAGQCSGGAGGGDAQELSASDGGNVGHGVSSPS